MNDNSSAQAAISDATNMIDIVFDLNGASVPGNYPFALWSEVTRCLPWLEDEKSVGILPLRGSASGDVLLLSKRTKLVLRVPTTLAAKTVNLTGQKLNIEGHVLTVGHGRERSLQPTTTLHAHLVESNLSEIEFLAEMKEKLRLMNIPCNLICDKHRVVRGVNHSLSGFGLVLHEMKPLASIQIQCAGLGGARHFGCGIFVPFKAISGLD